MINIKRSIPKKRSIKILCVILALVFIFAMSGCADPEPVSDLAIVVPTAEPSPAPAEGGELRVPMPENAAFYNPLSVNTEEMKLMYSLVFESLVRVDKENLIVPALAENWAADETGKVWTFNLRKNVLWHNSTSVFSSSDVEYTYQKLLAMGSDTYYSYAAERISSVEAIDANTVKITMKEPGYASLYALTFPIMCANVDMLSADFPIGTGPYFVSESNDSRLVLSANKNWWRQGAYIPRIIFEARDDNETALASYQAGQLNFVPTSNLSSGKYREQGVSVVQDVMTQISEVMLINHQNGILQDIRVRKALAYALNRIDLVSNVYMNHAFLSDVPVAPDSFLYESKSKIYDYDLDAADALLNEAGWTDKDNDGIREKDNSSKELTLTLLVNDSTESNARHEAAMLMQSQLALAGFEIEIVALPFKLGDEKSEYAQKLKSGDFDLALAGFNLSRDTDLSVFLKPGGKHNYGHYNNSAMAILADAVVHAADETAARDAASELQMRFVEDLPFINLYFRMNSIVYSAEIKGVQGVREPDIFANIEKWYINTAAGQSGAE
ncbi:MAG: Oligopeptide-binding protein AppA precursor [Firmicutes bacterium ADurb.Bin182]|nr:MAG: Oligopeptide-binding protein AppA precursor [Firmicutes bacterium ADurb.Bin182]